MVTGSGPMVVDSGSVVAEEHAARTRTVTTPNAILVPVVDLEAGYIETEEPHGLIDSV